MRENRNGTIWTDCFICGSTFPENIMYDEWHAHIGVINICPKCTDYWDNDDDKGMSMKKSQGWSKVYQDYKDAKEAI